MTVLPLHYNSCIDQAAEFTATTEQVRSALYWLERWCREQAYDRHYRQPCRNRQRFTVSDSLTIRTRQVELTLHVQPNGSRIKRWRVDGHRWRDAEVRQLIA
jgi:hypothetical protein